MRSYLGSIVQFKILELTVCSTTVQTVSAKLKNVILGCWEELTKLRQSYDWGGNCRHYHDHNHCYCIEPYFDFHQSSVVVQCGTQVHWSVTIFEEGKKEMSKKTESEKLKKKVISFLNLRYPPSHCSYCSTKHMAEVAAEYQINPLPSYGHLEMVLEAAAAGGSGASKFHNPAPSTSNTTKSSTSHHLWHSTIMNTIMYSMD